MSENNPLFQELGLVLEGVSINSVDIMQQKFSVKFRGYDVQDVDAFLEVVAKEMERLAGDNARMQQEIIIRRKELEQYKKKEESINAALVTVQRMSEDMKKNAAIEAEAIVNSSRQEAESFLSETRQKCDEMKEEVRPIKEEAKLEAQSIIHEAKKYSDAMHEEVRPLREEAHVEAQKLIDAAHLEANRINEEAIKKHSQIQEEINTLKQRKVQFQVTLKGLIETHLKFLENESSNE